MNNAILTFTPLEPYFFGSELTHGDGGANYFAISNRWPQQSTLCGFIRHLLHETGYCRGHHSFNPEQPEINDHGDLLKLSPMFLCKNEGDAPQYFLRQAIDRHAKGNAFEATLSDADNWMLNPYRPDWQKAVVWKGFDHKKSTVDSWVPHDGSKPIKAEDIFLERTRPGITKKPDAANRKREAGFYKQTAYCLQEKWAFAVLVQFSEKVVLNRLDGYCLPFGGEKTVFSIGVKAESREFEDLFPSSMFYPERSSELPALVLVSDAYVPRDVLKHAISGFTESVDFRHIRTHLKVENFAPLVQDKPVKDGGIQPENHGKMTKSTKYSLMARGSVLVCENNTALEQLATALRIEPWQNIGFNHFFTYPSISK